MTHPVHASQIAILGLPFDANSSYLRGPALAPPLIRKALHSDSSNMWTENGTDLGAPGALHDAGDLPIETLPCEKAFERVTSSVSDLLGENARAILLGGDHSLTYPVVRAFAKKYPGLNILHVDAHPDLYDEFEGNRFSHACPFARIMEEKLAARLVQVGIRTMNGHQREQAKRFGVEVNEMRSLYPGLELNFNGPLYISFDMDALDPAFAPGVSHHEPGGLTTRQAIALIQSFEAPQLVGADIVEYNPARDPLGITAMAAAKLLKEIAARMLG